MVGLGFIRLVVTKFIYISDLDNYKVMLICNTNKYWLCEGWAG
jgi:hypothetical protein